MALVSLNDPFYARDLDVAALQEFVEARGGEWRDPTNMWEVARYTLAGQLHIIYKNKRDILTYCGDSRGHVQQARGGRKVMRSPAKRKDEGSNPSHASTSIKDVIERWPGVQTDPPRTSTSDCSEPEGRRKPSPDHSEKPPWEE